MPLGQPTFLYQGCKTGAGHRSALLLFIFSMCYSVRQSKRLFNAVVNFHPKNSYDHPFKVFILGRIHRTQPMYVFDRQLCRRLSDAWGSVPEERSPARRRCRSSLSFSCSHPPLFKFVICLRSIQTLKIAKCSCMYSIQYFFCFLKPTIRSRGQAYLYADGTEKPGRNDSSRASNTCGYIQ